MRRLAKQLLHRAKELVLFNITCMLHVVLVNGFDGWENLHLVHKLQKIEHLDSRSMCPLFPYSWISHPILLCLWETDQVESE